MVRLSIFLTISYFSYNFPSFRLRREQCRSLREVKSLLGQLSLPVSVRWGNLSVYGWSEDGVVTKYSSIV